MIKAVIFDLDDTLVQTSGVRYEALKYAGRAFYGLEVSDEEIREAWGLPFEEFMVKIYGEVDEAGKMVVNYRSVLDRFPNIAYPDALATANSLLENFEVGVVSSADKEIVIHDLVRLGFPVDRFICIQGAEDTEVHKPDPKVFEPIFKVLREKEIEPIECLYVGDALNDYLAAKGAAMEFVGLVDRTTSREVFEKEGVRTITELSELFSVLK